jgi:DNA-binding transcriptional LysR family regulator
VAESRLLPQSLMALRKIAPQLQIRVQEGTTASLIDQLRRGEIDCVIGRLDPHATGRDLHTERLVKLPTRIVVRHEHPLAGRKRLTPEQLVSYPWVLPQHGAPIRIVIESMFSAVGLTPPVPIVESAMIRLNFELVRASDMIGVMPDDAAQAYAAARSLAILPLDLGARLPFVGVTTRPAPPTQALTLFLRVLRETCG